MLAVEFLYGAREKPYQLEVLIKPKEAMQQVSPLNLTH